MRKIQEIILIVFKVLVPGLMFIAFWLLFTFLIQGCSKEPVRPIGDDPFYLVTFRTSQDRQTVWVKNEGERPVYNVTVQVIGKNGYLKVAEASFDFGFVLGVGQERMETGEFVLLKPGLAIEQYRVYVDYDKLPIKLK